MLPSVNETTELYEHHRIAVEKGQQPLRIDKFLANRLPGISRNRIQNAAIAENILVNDKAVRSNYKIKPADVISIVLPYPPHDKEIKPENIPVEILYEDEWILVINKKAGMVVHPAQGNYTGTLMNALLYYVGSCNVPSVTATGNSYPYLIHRLDKNTSGLMVVAKDEVTQAKIAKQFFDRTIKKKYIAFVWGNIKSDSGIITGNIGRNVRNRKIMDVFPEPEHGKPAETHFSVAERFGFATVVECYPKTGRTHQIRIHFKHIGHPLFNDAEYGGDKILKGSYASAYKQFIENCFALLPRQALHAVSLGFIHPHSGKQITFTSELPYDMAHVMEKWRQYVKTDSRLQN